MTQENLVVCTKCGVVNRLPLNRHGAGAKCGKCGALLFSGLPSDIDAMNFDRQIGRGSLPVLCRRLGSMVRPVQNDGSGL